MASADVPPQLASLEQEVRDIFKLLSTGFQRLDKIKNVERQTRQLEELTAKMREAKRMIKDFDRDIKEEEREPQTMKLLTEKKQSLIKELNSYVALRKTYTSSFGSKHELLDGGSFSGSVRDVGAPSTMSNQEVMETGKKQMDETDQTTETSEKVKEDKVNIGAETTVTSTEQTEQLSKTNKASKVVKKIGRQIATDRCIMFFLLLIVVGVVAILAVKLSHPSSEGVQASGSTPPPPSRRLLLSTSKI